MDRRSLYTISVFLSACVVVFVVVSIMLLIMKSVWPIQS